MGLPKGKTAISVTIDGAIGDMIGEYAKELGIPKATFARNLLYMGMMDLSLLKNIGGLWAGVKFRDMVQYVFKDSEGNPRLFYRKDKKPSTITITVDVEVKETLEKYSDYMQLSLSVFARNNIYTALDDFKFLKKFGFVKLSTYSSAFKCFVKGYLENEEIDSE